MARKPKIVTIGGRERIGARASGYLAHARDTFLLKSTS
jgi:hypothetical protein